MRQIRRAPGAGALTAAAVVLALFVLCVVLTILTRDLRASYGGALPVAGLLFAALGLLVVRRRPGNPIGWLLVGCCGVTLLMTAAGLYAVLDYRIGQGSLPGGRTAVFVQSFAFLAAVLCGLAIFLFPDGTLPSRRWRWVLWVYLAASAAFMANQFIEYSTVLTVPHLSVDVTGSPLNNPDPVGVPARIASITGTALPVVAACWVCFVARQALSYRRASGERRQQLKWLMSGGAICVIGIVVTIEAGNYSTTQALAAQAVGFLCVAALPVSIGVGILRYRLYDIDRIISRTVAYAIVTGLLVGVYAGLVLLATEVLSFRAPVAVAASTLAAAALFTPLRRSVQRRVDRRFNRAGYDADQTVAAFAARLKDVVALDGVRDELVAVTHQALEPARISVWVSRDG